MGIYYAANSNSMEQKYVNYTRVIKGVKILQLVYCRAFNDDNTYVSAMTLISRKVCMKINN